MLLAGFQPITWAVLGFTAALVTFDVIWILLRRRKAKHKAEIGKQKRGL
jgi:hypothetical protein